MLRANINLDRHLLLIRRPSARIKRRCAPFPYTDLLSHLGNRDCVSLNIISQI